MEHVENLLKATLAEVERLLNTRTVVGEPTTIEGHTIIPLVAIGFCFGGGGGVRQTTEDDEHGGTWRRFRRRRWRETRRHRHHQQGWRARGARPQRCRNHGREGR